MDDDPGAPSANQGPERIFKVILVGNTGVGKTSLVRRFVDNVFDPASTRADSDGVDMAIKYLDIPTGGAASHPMGALHSSKVTVKLQLLHAPGSQRFHGVTTGYFKQVQGIAILYDCGASPHEQVQTWLQDVERLTNKKEVVVFLVGCKRDGATPSRMGGMDDLLRSCGFPCVELSAKTGDNVESFFTKMSILIKDKIEAPSVFKLHKLFNHNKDSGERLEDEEDDNQGLGAKLKNYFSGKFQRQRRRVKQKVLGAIGATDVTTDPLYSGEKQRYDEFDQRLRVMQERIRSMYNGLSSAFQTGILLGDDFRWITARNSSEQTRDLILSFTTLMQDGQKVCNTLYDELRPAVERWGIAHAAATEGPERKIGTAPGAPPPDHIVYIPHVAMRMDQRERAVLDYDAYRRKLRNHMSDKEAVKDDKQKQKLKKIEAKLLAAQENFEVLNTQLIEELIGCHEQRASYMNSQFLLLLKSVMKLFHSVSKSLDNIVPVLNAALGTGAIAVPAAAAVVSPPVPAAAVSPSSSTPPPMPVANGVPSKPKQSPPPPPSEPAPPSARAPVAVLSPRSAAALHISVSPSPQNASPVASARPLSAHSPHLSQPLLIAARNADGSVSSGFSIPPSPEGSGWDQSPLRAGSGASASKLAVPMPAKPPRVLGSAVDDVDALFAQDAMRASQQRVNQLEEFKARALDVNLNRGFTDLHSLFTPPPTDPAYLARLRERDKSRMASANRGRRASQYVRPPPPPPMRPPLAHIAAAAAELASLRGQPSRPLPKRPDVDELKLAPVPSVPPPLPAATAEGAPSDASALDVPLSALPPPPAPPTPSPSATPRQDFVPATSLLVSNAPLALSGLGTDSDSEDSDLEEDDVSDTEEEKKEMLVAEPSLTWNPDIPEDEADGVGPANEEEMDPVLARALFNYDAMYIGDLSFKEGEFLLVYPWLQSPERTEGWWRGYCRGVQGWFPKEYVQLIDEDGEATAAKGEEAEGSDSEVDPSLLQDADSDDESVLSGPTAIAPNPSSIPLESAPPAAASAGLGALSDNTTAFPVPPLSPRADALPPAPTPPAPRGPPPLPASYVPPANRAPVPPIATAPAPAPAAAPSSNPLSPRGGPPPLPVRQLASPRSAAESGPGGACKESGCNCKGYTVNKWRPQKCANCPHGAGEHAS